MSDPRHWVWLIPLLPFAGFLLNGAVGRHLPRKLVGLIACGSVIASFALSYRAFEYVRDHGALLSAKLAWIEVAVSGSPLSFLSEHQLVIDPLSSLMILVITGVGSLIHIYSLGYMADEKRFARYFSYLNLFSGFMLILVTASNLLLMFVGWEGVGLCSYLLIGFWFEKVENASAGKKAFLVNRVGDLSFTIGALLLFAYLGETTGTWTVDFQQIRAALAANEGHLNLGLLTVVGLLLFGGATGKSAQIPLYVWLPDAMAGPTPVSALIHAATMVTAGVYMVARMNFLYVLTPWALFVVAAVGGLTALFAGTIAVCQNDIKKVLAYSTVSQLGFMFMGVGSGVFWAGIFHLMTHAFFKACLFLGSGSVIHGMGGEQDVRKMGGLFRKMPITAVTFMLASLALSGVVFTSGFFSKESVLIGIWGSTHMPFPEAGRIIAGMGFVAAGFTAFYMTRLVLKTFFGEPKWKAAHAEAGHDDAGHGADQDHGHDDHGHAPAHGHGEPHESPFSMWLPLVLLSILSIGGGWIPVEKWLAPVFTGGASLHGAGEGSSHHDEGGHPGWMVPLSIAISTGGILLGLFLYGRKASIPERIASEHPVLYESVLNKYYIDEFYQRAFVENLLRGNEALGRFDNAVIDGGVNGTASATAAVSQSTGFLDNEVVDGAVNGTGAAARAAGVRVRHLQTGNIRSYLAGAVAGGFFLISGFTVYLYRDEFLGLLRRVL